MISHFKESKIIQKESDILQQICELLTLKKIFFWRTNNITVSSDGIYRRPNKYFKYGIPDITGIYEGKVFFIEVKSESGTLSDAQKEFFEECNQQNILICLAKGRDAITIVEQKLKEIAQKT